MKAKQYNYTKHEHEVAADPLCCCEYINIDGERSHILAVCCDCEAIDDTFDRWFKRAAIPDSNYTRIAATIRDRMRVPWFGGAQKCSLDTIVPALVVPVLMLFATISPVTMFCSLVAMPIIILMSRMHLYHQPKTHFYYIWTCSSFFTLIYVFEAHVVTLRLISFYEHLVFAALLSAALICWYHVRARRGFWRAPGAAAVADAAAGAGATFCERCEVPRPARAFHCVPCGRCVLMRDHHCVWLDCCVGGANQRAFMAGVACAVLAMLQAGRLTLESVCGAGTGDGPLLLLVTPLSCRPDTAVGAAALFGAVYALVAAALCSALLLHQCLLVTLGQTGCERRRRLRPPGASAGPLRNWYRFLAGHYERLSQSAPPPLSDVAGRQRNTV